MWVKFCVLFDPDITRFDRLLQHIVQQVMDVGANVLLNELSVFCGRVNAVAEKDKEQSVFGIGPGAGTRETGMPEGEGRGIFAAWAVLFRAELRLVKPQTSSA